MKTTLRGGFVTAGLLVGIVWGRRSSPPSPLAPRWRLHHNQRLQDSGTPPPACQVRTDGSPKLPTVATGGVLR